MRLAMTSFWKIEPTATDSEENISLQPKEADLDFIDNWKLQTRKACFDV